MQQLGGAYRVSAGYDAVGMQKIDDCFAFTQEFRVGNHIEALRVHAVQKEHAANPLTGADRDRALFHNHLVVFDGAGNLRDHDLNIGEVGGAGVTLGSADSNKDCLATIDNSAEIGRELNGAIQMLGQQLRKVLFIDRDAAFAKEFYLGLIVIHAGNLVAHLRKADRCNESDISRPNDTD